MNVWRERISQHSQSCPEQKVFADETRSYSYRDLGHSMDSMQVFLSRNGIQKKDRVLVLLPRNATSALVLSCLLLNEVVAVFMEPKTPVDELQTTIASVHPKAVISAHDLKKISILEKKPLPEVFQTPFQSYQLSILSPGAKADLHPEGLTWLLHTSGTSGAAKAVMLSEDNLRARTLSEISDFGLCPQDIIFNCLPFSHDLGLNQVLCTLWLGATLFIKSRATANLIETLQSSGATGMTATPLVWIDLLKTQQEPMNTSLRYLTVSGGSLEPSQLEAVQNIFPGVRIIRTYGQTETFRTFINDTNDAGLGRLVAETQIALSSEGELVHYGPTAMTGYLFDKDLTATKIDPHGGILTGDLIRQDSSGRFHFQGRNDDLVKRFEQRFFLSEVEAVFCDMPGVIDAVAVVTPAPTQDWRQLYLGVFLQLGARSENSLEEFRDLAQRRLSYFKMPDIIKIVQTYPRTNSQKVDRQQLKNILVLETSL